MPPGIEPQAVPEQAGREDPRPEEADPLVGESLLDVAGVDPVRAFGSCAGLDGDRSTDARRSSVRPRRRSRSTEASRLS